MSGRVCGIDEAGRGPLAGPLVMSGVILHVPIDGLEDSKKLSQIGREKLYRKIIQHASFHLVVVSNRRIDHHGMRSALIFGLQAIKEALQAKRYLFDGPTSFGVEGIDSQVRADATIPEVSAASIIAKVYRDWIMERLDSQYPLYGFKKHKGYGTKEHIQAIRDYGISPIHRQSFKIKCLK